MDYVWSRSTLDLMYIAHGLYTNRPKHKNKGIANKPYIHKSGSFYMAREELEWYLQKRSASKSFDVNPLLYTNKSICHSWEKYHSPFSHSESNIKVFLKATTKMSSSTATSKPTVSYTLFLYREELNRREASYLRLNKTKFMLTDELISKSFKNLKECSTADLKAISRELLFKKKLKRHIRRINKLEKLGIRNANPTAQTTKL